MATTSGALVKLTHRSVSCDMIVASTLVATLRPVRVGVCFAQGQALSLLSQRLQQLQLQRAAYAPSSVHPTSLLAQAIFTPGPSVSSHPAPLCLSARPTSIAAALIMRTTPTS